VRVASHLLCVSLVLTGLLQGTSAGRPSWYYHVTSAAAVGNVGTAHQGYTIPEPKECWHDISDALNAIKADGHEGPWVVQVDDTARYDDSVTIMRFKTSATATLTIRRNPALKGRPTIYPSAEGKAALNIGGDSQRDGENNYVTVQGFIMSNNASGTERSTEMPVLANGQANLTAGRIVIEDCVFDGLGQTYDTRNTLMIYNCRVDTIFRNNEVRNFIAKKKPTEPGPERNAGLVVAGPHNAVNSAGHRVEIVGNSFHDNVGILSEFAENPNQQHGFSLLYEGNRIYHNTVNLANPRAGILVNIEGLNTDNVVVNNLFYDNAISTGWQAALHINNSDHTKVYHNTFFNNHARCEVLVFTTTPKHVQIKNNIFWPTPGSYCIDVRNSSVENLVFTNNVFFTHFRKEGYPCGFGLSTTEDTEPVGSWNGKSMTSDAWNKASKNNAGNGYAFEGPGLDKNLCLLAGSLCIDRGVPRLVGTDIDGHHRPVGAGYDIGAYEYAALGTVQSTVEEHASPLEGESMGTDAPLHLAAYQGDMAKIDACLQAGGDINKLDRRGYAPLHYAAQNGQKQALELLLIRGGDVNVRDLCGQTPLFNASDADREDVAELLISKGADINARNNAGQTSPDWVLSRARRNIVAWLINQGAELSLHTAVTLGDVDQVRLCLERGADVNAKGKGGMIPLCCAVDNKKKEIAELLIGRGAEINGKDQNGYTPLYWAIWNEDQGMARLLVAKGADVNGTAKDTDPPLHFAVYNEDVNSVRLLLDAGARFDVKDTEGWTALRHAASVGNRVMIDVFVAKGLDVSTLHGAACAGNLAQVKNLLDQGSEVDVKDECDWTPLYWAASAGQEEVGAFLVEKGAKVDATTTDGCTVMHQAARTGAVRLIDVLISGGADIKAREKDGATPLHYAAAAGELEAVQLLIAKGGNANARTMLDSTPLHGAARAGHKGVVEFLISQGANANVKDRYGRTPLNWAELGGHADTIKVLRRHQAEE